jgi:two-component system alkaline phosphatase synthesis response regulator PhoP
VSLRILLVEDEPGLVLTLTDLLRGEGYEIQKAADGVTGLAFAVEGSFDLMILDVMLPEKNGLDVCRELRQRGIDVPILMLTAKTHLVDRVVGLRLGADDYVAKPFEAPELLARVEALLRRSRKVRCAQLTCFRFGDVEIDFEKRDVIRKGVPVTLAGKELDLLRYLIERRGSVVTRDELLGNVWDYHAGASSRTIDVHVAWLRQKLEDDPQRPRHIQTIRGLGYRFSA